MGPRGATTANFRIKSEDTISKAPSKHCYDDRSLKSLSPEENEKCREAVLKAEEYEVGILQFLDSFKSINSIMD